ncbi:MAG: class I SAM-dependent methyltransferase [Pseudomonadota bacterium]
MPTNAVFWDRLARRYAAQPIKDATSYNHTLERTQSYLGSEDRVLELGCGTGSTALALAPSVKEYTGSDISSGMIEIANEKASEAGQGNVRFRQATLEEHSGEPDRFDAILAFNLFHLVDDPFAAFRSIHKLLPSGGHFISKTACLKGQGIWLRPMIAAMRAVGKAPKVTFLSANDVEVMIARAGFDILETGTFPARARFVVAKRR